MLETLVIVLIVLIHTTLVMIMSYKMGRAQSNDDYEEIEYLRAKLRQAEISAMSNEKPMINVTYAEMSKVGVMPSNIPKKAVKKVAKKKVTKTKVS